VSGLIEHRHGKAKVFPYERERADYISLCPDEFVKAWNAWDQSDPTKMPPLPKKPCLLASRGHVYVCSEEEGGCSLITHNLGPQGGPS
jgi:hypothetical protein